MKSTLLTLLLTTMSTVSLAAVSTGPRTILDMGCHRNDGTCYVTISGAAVLGAPGCNSTSLRWNSTSDANGKSTLASLLVAKATGSTVDFYVDSCYASNAAYPTFGFFSVK